MRRYGGSRRRKDATWMLLTRGGLQRYAGDVQGLRYFGGDEREEVAHNAQQVPSFPLLGHAPLIHMFRQTNDVSSDSWDITEVGSGTQLALQDEMGGIAKAVTGALDNNSQTYFSKAAHAQISNSGVITLKTEIRFDEPVQCDAFIGFCGKSVNLITGRQNAVGFYLDDGSALIRVETNSGGSSEQEASEVTAVAGQWYQLAIGIHCDPTWSVKHVEFFIDQRFVAEHKTNIPTAAMAFAFGIQNGEAAANGLSIGTIFLLKD